MSNKNTHLDFFGDFEYFWKIKLQIWRKYVLRENFESLFFLEFIRCRNQMPKKFLHFRLCNVGIIYFFHLFGLNSVNRFTSQSASVFVYDCDFYESNSCNVRMIFSSKLILSLLLSTGLFFSINKIVTLIFDYDNNFNFF